MRVSLTEPQRIAWEAAVRSEKRTRSWKRYQAIFLLAEGQSPAAVAQAVRCCVGSISNWARRWQAAELAGVAEGPHPGVARRLDAQGETRLAALLETDPQQRGDQATGWTVPLRRTALVVAGYRVSERTVRRTIHRLGYRWKRPQYVLGRPDPAYAEKKGP
jgi:putative transposase